MRSVVERFVTDFHMACPYPSHRGHSGNGIEGRFRTLVVRQLPPEGRPSRVLQHPQELLLHLLPPLLSPCHLRIVRLERWRHSRTGTSIPPALQLQLGTDILRPGERRPPRQRPKRPAPFRDIARLVVFLVQHSPVL
jgi:hypothetical protein